MKLGTSGVSESEPADRKKLSQANTYNAKDLYLLAALSTVPLQLYKWRTCRIPDFASGGKIMCESNPGFKREG